MPLDERFLARLERITPVRRAEPMARHTTLHVGGPAAAYVSVTHACLLRQVVRLAHEAEAPLCMIGAGSNLLVSDRGIDGLVVDTWANNQGLPLGGTPGGQPPLSGGETPDVPAPRCYRVYAGAPLPRLAHQAAAAGLSGLEWAVGVPGTAGGGAVNNAGAHGTEMSDIVHAVHVFDGREERILSNAAIGYGYRSSTFRRAESPGVVMEVELVLESAPIEEVRARIEEFAAYRRSTQPSQLSVGSIFKNPPDNAAGRLIEQAGLKGKRIGDAEVSPKHANFIVNRGAARSADVYELVMLVQRTVKQSCQIELDLEIQVVGEGW